MGMIQIDMPMPERCDDCRFCVVEYTDDNKPDSFAYCCAAEKFIAKSCDGMDKTISIALILKQTWCPLKAQEPVRHGRWLKMTGMLPPEYHGHYECSECQWHMKGLRNSWTREEELTYCPNCGAKMDDNINEIE